MMKLYDLKKYEYDENKVGDLIITCTGKRGKFVGKLESRVDYEKLGDFEFKRINKVEYYVNNKKYISYQQSVVTPELYKDMQRIRPDINTLPYIEHVAISALNNAYRHYKEDLRRK